MSDWFFEPLERGAYDFIMADPPWSFLTRSQKGVTEKGAGGQYRVQDMAWVKSLPVADLAAKDCLLWLWATNPMLDQQMDVLKAWGFRFTTAGTWAKRTKHGKLAFGTGFVLRCASEPFLIGKRGKPTDLPKNIRSLFEGPLRGHSRKPDEAYAIAERMRPNARRADLFAREVRPGWDAWGDQIHHFSEATA